MKKFALIPVLAIMLVCFVAAEAEGTFSYSVLSDGTAEISGYEGTATKLEIPEYVDGYKVTVIGEEAFWAAIPFPKLPSRTA